LPEALVSSLTALDAYRAGFAEAPATLTNPVLLGTVLAPLGLAARHARHDADPATEAAAVASGGLLGMLPVARRDVERLSYALALVRRLEEVDGPPRARATLVRRHAFPDALTWLEIRGDAPRAVAFWRDQLAEAAGSAAGSAAGETGDEALPGLDGIAGDDAPRRRRRRRRGRRRSA
jgi:hypothetical protein